MATKAIPCPACHSDIPVKIDETLRKVIDIAKFCPSCGIQIHRRCPNCNSSFSKLTPFCHQCGKEVHGRQKQASTSLISLSAEADQLLNRLRQDALDSAKLIRETLLVVTRCNPPNLAAHRFYEIVASISDNTPRTEIATLVGQALNEAQGALDTEALENWRGFAGNIVTEVVAATRKSLDATLSDWRTYISHPWIEQPESHAQRIRLQLETAMSVNLRDVSVIQHKYRQMCEFYPRYQEIMSRNEVWDYVLGFAAGFLGGQVGAIGAQVWDDWRNKSDRDFIQSFTAAVEQFTQASFSFMQKTEASVVPVVDQVMAELGTQCDAVIGGLDKLARKGKSIATVFRALHFADETVVDDDARQILEVVIANLREQGLTHNSEHNIREMLGLDQQFRAFAVKQDPGVLLQAVIVDSRADTGYVSCPYCHHSLAIAPSNLGTKIQCLHCRAQFVAERG